MKACDSCVSNRVEIGKNYKTMPVWVRAIGMVFIYLPILTLPFIFLSAYLSYYHLLMMGAKDVKTLKDYLPARETHRYDMKTQITMDGSFKASTSQSKTFWMLNCTWYCPVSVGLFEWHSYLVKLVENFWCPFTHGTKENYCNANIDKSFWHIYPSDAVKLHEDDLKNPIWNEDEAFKKESE